MFSVRQVAGTVFIVALTLTAASAQTKKPAGTNTVTYDVTIQADGAYAGTMDIAVKGGVASGAMHITTPTEITGKVAGTVKGGQLLLDFPYSMVTRKCTGQIEMNIKLPARPGPATGTVSIVGCGRDVSNKLAGTIELKPAPKK